MQELSNETSKTIRFVGRIGLVAVAGVAVILAIHPFGSTSLYADGEGFLEHVGLFWIVIHLVAALLLFSVPVIVNAWAAALSTVEARAVGRFAGTMATIGMAVGAVHLITTDTLTFHFFADTFEDGGGEGAVLVSADLLLRFHAATLTTWVLSFWMAVPALIGVAAFLDGRVPQWFGGLGLMASFLQVPAVVITIAEGQWTTLSETVLFRIGATLLLVLLLIQTNAMRRGTVYRLLSNQSMADVTA